MTTTTATAWPRRDANGRTNQPVRRNSRERRAQEPRFFISRQDQGDRLRAFQDIATRARQKGKRRGHDGGYGLYCADVLNYLMGFAATTGQIWPSYEDIAEKVGCAYRTAVRCIKQLKEGGWLTWERRLIRVANGGALEPQVHQDSNYYHLKLPKLASTLIAAIRRQRRNRVPDDVTPALDDAEDPRNALLAIEDAVRRRDRHLMDRIALTRTTDGLLRLFASRDDFAANLDRLGEAVHKRAAASAQREFPEGSQSRG